MNVFEKVRKIEMTPSNPFPSSKFFSRDALDSVCTVSYLLLLDASFPIKCQKTIDSSKIHVLCFLNQIINNRFDSSKIRVHCFLNQIINNRFDSSKMHVVCFLKYIINNSWTWTFFEESIIFCHLIGKLAL